MPRLWSISLSCSPAYVKPSSSARVTTPPEDAMASATYAIAERRTSSSSSSTDQVYQLTGASAGGDVDGCPQRQEKRTQRTEDSADAEPA